MWTVRKTVWDRLAVLKFRANKPVRIPLPQDSARTVKAVSLASKFPRIPVENVLIGDHVPDDEASTVKSRFFDLQVGLYGGLSPMEAGLASIDADPQKALDEAYTDAHRKCFPAPVLPPEYQAPVDLGFLAVAGPYACYVERAPEGGFHWDLRRLARHEHHAGLYSLAVRVLFRVNAADRRLEAARIESELGTSVAR